MGFIDTEELKNCLLDYVQTVTQKSKSGMYVCPICGSGEGKNHTGAFSINKDGKRWKCFACDAGGDIYDLCAAVEHITLSDATKRIMERYGTSALPGRVRSGTEREAPAQPAQQKTYKEDIERYAAALPGSPAESYLQGRGLTAETMKRFNLGYDAQRKCVTIPYNPQGTYYGRRSVEQDAARKHDNLPGAAMPLFNGAALTGGADVVFIVESPLCAISIEQAGGAAVAISGTGGKSRLLDALKRKQTAATLLLCLDNDEAGRKASEDIGTALDALEGITAYNVTAALLDDPKTPYKDPNELLQRVGAEELKTRVSDLTEQARTVRAMAEQEAAAAEAEERAQRTGAGMVDNFLQVIRTRKYEPIPTGIPEIDRVLCGGFMRQQLIMLGAAPGAGKTALAQWLFENMAARGTSVVFLNLEMSREQLLARSISRISAQERNGVKGFRVRALDVLQGYRWTEPQEAAILDAAKVYKETIAPRMIMNPDKVTANLDNIMEYLEAEAQRAEKAGEAAPMCVIDYLQLLSGEPREDTASVLKRAVAALKGYAVRHNTVCFVIIAHNRSANSTGVVSMEAARDTSAIEYSADLMLALTFTGTIGRDGESPKYPKDLTDEERKFVTLRIVKGRFGGTGTDVDLHFDGETMTYQQVKYQQEEEQETVKRVRV